MFREGFFMHSFEQSSKENINELLSDAQRLTWDAVDRIRTKMTSGLNESQAKKIATEILADMGSRKFWHKCHIRFGASTALGFDDPYSDTVLKDNDIFYIDIGPIWNGIEGDAGASFVVGQNTEYLRCCKDAKEIFDSVATHWKSTKATGAALYEFAGQEAKARGWILAPSYVKGHRLSEFPHSMHTKSSVRDLDFCPNSHRWVLEIQICDPALKFGAFYEDILV
jgi:methionine aminopeptidase